MTADGQERRLAEIANLSNCPRRSLHEALLAEGGAGRAVLFEGGHTVPGRPMLWPCPYPEIEGPHLGAATTADVELHVAADVIVGGRGGHVRRNGGYIYADGPYPNYIRQWMERDTAAEYWAFEPDRDRAARLPVAISLVHYNFVYGHWLLEVFPKLFVIEHLAQQGLRAPIILPSTAPGYVREAIEDLLPGQEIACYDPAAGEQVAVDRLLLPGAMQWEYIFHPEFGRRLDAYVQSRRTSSRTDRRVFVSRAARMQGADYRRLENGLAVEAAAARLGLEIVQAETLSWRDKIELFAGAALVVGEFGSGLHNTLLSPAGTKVVALNWVFLFQSRVANFREQDVGYLLPTDGRPRTFSLDPGMQSYRLDVEAFRSHVGPLMDGASRARRPGAWRRA